MSYPVNDYCQQYDTESRLKVTSHLNTVDGQQYLHPQRPLAPIIGAMTTMASAIIVVWLMPTTSALPAGQ